MVRESSHRFSFVWAQLLTPGRRPTVGSVRVGVVVSASLKAQTLLLMDLQEKTVLFFQGVETIEVCWGPFRSRAH